MSTKPSAPGLLEERTSLIVPMRASKGLMHRFWPIIEEFLRATRARRICEIGADDGRHTRRLLEFCAANGGFLEVVDPDPKFDARLWPEALCASWALHREASLDALRHLSPCDIYLVDGDHNWFTVTNELRLIHESMRGAEREPIVFLHDTGWPYGRRDLYYVPERIPEQSRHPYAQRALRQDVTELCETGLNGHLNNALREGEPRSGVLSAVEDYVAARGHDVVVVHVPFWFGLTLLVPSKRLGSEPLLAAAVAKVRAFSEFGVLADLERERVALLVSSEASGVAARLPERRPATGSEERLKELELELAEARSRAETGAWNPAALATVTQPAISSRTIRDSVERIDIVVPVHEAFEDVERCLRSLRRCTDGKDVRVLVVDDGSSSRTAERLSALIGGWTSFSLLKHPSNLGYTRAVNTGLGATSAPWVVVLNSDTVVTAGWLTSLLRCASSDPAVGLVGPLSNAASWQSVPLAKDSSGFIVNPLPDGLDADGMAQLVKDSWNGRYPDVGVLNGFCTLVRREVLERVGELDAVAFPTGYGEENDYCLRAAAAGFKLRVASDAFVYHAKSRSFGHAARVELSKAGAKALVAKHGADSVARLSDAMHDHQELKAARAAVNEALRVRAAGNIDPFSLRVLFLLPVFGVSGGASSVIREAAEMARLGVFVRVAVPEERLGDLGELYSDVPAIREILIAAPLPSLLELGKSFDVAVATVYYTMEWVARIVAASPSTLPAYYVQDYEPWFFDDGSAEASAARNSYRRHPRALIFAKSQFLLRTLAEHHSVHALKVTAGLDHSTFHPGPRPRASRIRVTAMVRPQTPRRGAARTMRVLASLAAHLGQRVDIHIFGCATTDPRFQALERDFQFVAHGVLRRPAVAELLRSSDIFLDLSDYQAFGRSSLEAMACGCVPVVPSVGGGEEFARDGINTLVVDTRDEPTCVERVATLVRSPSLLEAMRRVALATAARFSLRQAALSELHVMGDAARVWQAANPSPSRQRLVLARSRGFDVAPWEMSATVGGWTLPSVQRGFHVTQVDGLPPPGSADVVVVFVDVETCACDVLDAWLEQWRARGARVVFHLGSSRRAGGEVEAGEAELVLARWLASAGDALVASPGAVFDLLHARGLPVQAVPFALDGIVWRLGPAARRLKEGRDDAPARVGLLGDVPSPELAATVGAAVKELQLAYGDRISFEVCESKQAKWATNMRFPGGRQEEASWAEWAFGSIAWDVALVPFAGADRQRAVQEARLLVPWALGSALVVRAGHGGTSYDGALSWARGATDDVTAWRDAIAELVEDRRLRFSLSEEARARLDLHQSHLDADGAAAALLARVTSSGPSPIVPLPPELRKRRLRLWKAPLSAHLAVIEPGTQPFPAARSPWERKLTKLRRDPARFFGDAKLKPLRLLKGFFD